MNRLYRSTRNRKIAGICGGIGEYLNVDPSLIRIIWLLITFAFGVGILLYLICWIVLPEDRELLEGPDSDEYR